MAMGIMNSIISGEMHVLIYCIKTPGRQARTESQENILKESNGKRVAKKTTWMCPCTHQELSLKCLSFTLLTDHRTKQQQIY